MCAAAVVQDAMAGNEGTPVYSTGTEVSSRNAVGFNSATEVKGTVVAATSCDERGLAFTDTRHTVKLRGVVYQFQVPEDPAKTKYIVPTGLTLEGIEIDAKPWVLSTNDISGSSIKITPPTTSSKGENYSAIVFITLPLRTNAAECLLLAGDLLIHRLKSMKRSK